MYSGTGKKINFSDVKQKNIKKLNYHSLNKKMSQLREKNMKIIESIIKY